jgi:hypothetical protein
VIALYSLALLIAVGIDFSASMLGLALDRIAEAQAAAGRLARASRRAERTHLRAADVHERAAELYESLGKAAEAARERAQASAIVRVPRSNDAGALSEGQNAVVGQRSRMSPEPYR